MSGSTDRDMRSAARTPQRAKASSRKWSRGARPLGNLPRDTVLTTEEQGNRRLRVRPIVKAEPTGPKNRHNRAVKPSNLHLNMSKTRFSSRVSRHIDAVLESQDPKDASLNNPGLSIPDIIPQEREETGGGDSLEEDEEGREVELKKLVEEAEEKWESGRTEKIVQEYEILDRDGEKMKLSRKRAKGRDIRRLGDGVSNSDTGSNEDDNGEGFEFIEM